MTLVSRGDDPGHGFYIHGALYLLLVLKSKIAHYDTASYNAFEKDSEVAARNPTIAFLLQQTGFPN
jgi:hypothetical protein